jgi:hypothetical protein
MSSIAAFRHMEVTPPHDHFQNLLAAREVAAQQLRTQLAQRTATEKAYDDYLLAQLRRGKKFKIAFRKANAKFPAKALTPKRADLTAIQERYHFILRMESIEERREALFRAQKKIAELDSEMATFMEKIAAAKNQLPGEKEGCSQSAQAHAPVESKPFNTSPDQSTPDASPRG